MNVGGVNYSNSLAYGLPNVVEAVKKKWHPPQDEIIIKKIEHEENYISSSYESRSHKGRLFDGRA